MKCIKINGIKINENIIDSYLDHINIFRVAKVYL